MKRRQLLGTVGLTVTGLAGCASISPRSQPKDDRTTKDCRALSEPESPSRDNLTFEYTVSGDGGVQYEIIDLFNTGDSPVDLTNHSVSFEDQNIYEINNIELIPGAELKFLTYGEKNISKFDGECLKYRHVIEDQLDSPLFEDSEAKVALLEPDGSHLLVEKFTIGRG